METERHLTYFRGGFPRNKLWIAIAALALVSTSCARVNPQPFTLFTESLRTLSSGVEAQEEFE